MLYTLLYSLLVNSANRAGNKTNGAQEGIRTPTPDKGKRILSLMKLAQTNPWPSAYQVID